MTRLPVFPVLIGPRRVGKKTISRPVISDHPDLAVYTPKFYGRVDPGQLRYLPQGGYYIQNCGLRLEKIPGKDVKVSQLDSDIKMKVDQILGRLKDRVDAGNVWDSSCFVPGTRAEFTLIDFANLEGRNSKKYLVRSCRSNLITVLSSMSRIQGLLSGFPSA